MVYIFLGTGFEEIEALTACDLMRRAGIEVALVGVNGMEIVGSHGITVRTDMPLEGQSGHIAFWQYATHPLDGLYPLSPDT